MKTAIVLSDTHGYTKWLDRLKPLFAENDFVIHLGDGNRDMRDTYVSFPDKTFVCQGNCDFATMFSAESWEIEIEGCKVFCAHGHRFNVKYDLCDLAEEAKKRGCNVALYGHTHEAGIEVKEGVTLVNPGAAGLYTSQPSYAYLVFSNGKVTATIVPFA